MNHDLKTIRNKITLLLFLSLIISIIVSSILMLLLTDWGGDDGGIIIVIMTEIFTIGGFALSLFAYFNLLAKFRKNKTASLFSFTLLPATLVANSFVFFSGFERGSIKEIMIINLCISPYLISMILSYIIFRKFCKKNNWC